MKKVVLGSKSTMESLNDTISGLNKKIDKLSQSLQSIHDICTRLSNEMNNLKTTFYGVKKKKIN